MFKKLLLLLVLVFTLSLPVYAMDSGQTCTLIQGSKVIQVMPDRSLRGVTVPNDIKITIGPEMPKESAKNFSAKTGMNWESSHVGSVEVDFGAGPQQLFLFIKTNDVKDCK